MLPDVDAQVSALLGLVVAVGTRVAGFLTAALDVLVAAQCRLPSVALAAVTALVLSAGFFAIAGHRIVTHRGVELLAVLVVLALVGVAEVDLHVFRELNVVDAVLQIVHHLVGEVVALGARVGGGNFEFRHLMGALVGHGLDDELLSVGGRDDDRFGGREGIGGLDCRDADVLDLLAVREDLSRANLRDLQDLMRMLMRRCGIESRRVLVARVFDARMIRLVDDLLLIADVRRECLFWHFLNDRHGLLLDFRNGLRQCSLHRDEL